MTYGNHGVIAFYTRMAAASLRIRGFVAIVAVYSRIYTVGSRIFTDIRGGFANIRVFYTGFAEALRLLSTVFIRCVDCSGTAERRGNLRFGQPYRTAAVVVHFNAAFFGVICRQELKLDNTQ